MNWDDVTPRSSQGKYYVGVSQVLRTEPAARDDALRNAKELVIRSEQEGVTYAGSSSTSWSSDGSQPSTSIEGGSSTESSSLGNVANSNVVAWCDLDVSRPTGGTDYVRKVLIFMPGT